MDGGWAVGANLLRTAAREACGLCVYVRRQEEERVHTDGERGASNGNDSTFKSTNAKIAWSRKVVPLPLVEPQEPMEPISKAPAIFSKDAQIPMKPRGYHKDSQWKTSADSKLN